MAVLHNGQEIIILQALFCGKMHHGFAIIPGRPTPFRTEPEIATAVLQNGEYLTVLQSLGLIQLFDIESGSFFHGRRQGIDRFGLFEANNLPFYWNWYTCRKCISGGVNQHI